MLAAIPETTGETQIDAIWMGRKPIFWRPLESKVKSGNHDNVFESDAKDLVLQVKLNELMNIEHETVKHGGWNN